MLLGCLGVAAVPAVVTAAATPVDTESAPFFDVMWMGPGQDPLPCVIRKGVSHRGTDRVLPAVWPDYRRNQTDFTLSPDGRSVAWTVIDVGGDWDCK